jgi:hypothetical protein
MLADLVAGATDSSPYGYHRPFDDNVTTTSVNGGGTGNVGMLLDGASNEAPAINITGGSTEGAARNSYVAPVDSVQEFRMITSPYDAQYGLMAGAVEDVILKSGTNKIHGDVYEFARRTWMDANSWVNDYKITQLTAGATAASAGLNTAKMKWDQFGFELDGPISIPKLYSGKNRSFFTVQWEHMKMFAPVTDTGSVPDPAWSGKDGKGGGNFSNLTYYQASDGSYTPKQIYDPLTSTLTGGQWVRTAFANNQIPLTGGRMDAMAQAIAKMYPTPNQKTVADSWNGNYVLSTAGIDKYNNILLKWDENISSKDRFNLRYGYWMRNTTYNGNGMPAPLTTGYVPKVARAHTFATNEVHTFSPNLLLEFKANVGVRDDILNGGSSFDPTTIGWTKALVDQMGAQAAANELPDIRLGGYACSLGWGGCEFTEVGNNGNTEAVKNSMNIAPMVTWIKGAHSIHAGLDARFWQNGYTHLAGGSNFFTDSSWTYATANHTTPSNFDGNDIASFLLGVPNSGGNQIWPGTYQTQHYWAVYVQDDWKITKKLTLNLGARWDFLPSLVTRRDIGNYAWDTMSYNPINNVAGLDSKLAALGVSPVLGGVTFLGAASNNSRHTYAMQRLNIQPRFGFAYALNNKTVLRGGFGASMRTPQNGPVVDGYSATTYSVTSDLTNSGGVSMVFPLLANKLETPYATNGIVQPTGRSLGLLTQMGDGNSFLNPAYKAPEFWSYSLGFERQLSKNSSINVSYVGSRLYKGETSTNINLQGDESLRYSCNVEQGGLPEWCGGVSSDGKATYNNYANPFKGVSGFDTGNSHYTDTWRNKLDLTRPMPQFDDVTENLMNNGRTWYNSLQITAMHRMGKSLTLHGTETWSKSMSAGSWTDQNYGVVARNIDGGDVAHRISLSGIYTLPIGRGHMLLPTANRIIDTAIGGWELSGMSVISTGTPVTVTSHYLHNAKLTKYRQADKHGIYQRFFEPCAERYVRNDSASNTKDNYSPYSIVKYNDPNTFLGGSNTTYDYTGTCANGSDFRDVGSYAPSLRTTYTGMRTDGNKSFDTSLSKNFELYQSFKLQLRIDAFNVLNHPEWTGGPDTGTGDGNFGILDESGGASNSSRIGQLSAKITW